MSKKPREIFLKGCNEIAEVLILHGFKVAQKGQTVSKRPNKDITLQVYFQSSHYNDENSVTIIPHITVYSKAVKTFDIKAYKNEYCTGIVWGKQLCYILGAEYKIWNLAKTSYARTVSEIQKALTDTVLPLFDVFCKSPGEIIEYGITQKLDISLSYFLVFGGKETAERVFQTKINQCQYKGQYMKLYNTLLNMKEDNIDPKYNEFVGAGEMKMAYLQGLRLR
ncbi:hypothetical protein HMPREF1977_0603 [Capnocytophaga ochracea F0287]|uniref:DUF4304 domain-containing protein n=1 Tax=Capnocytophaga ochracea F0287 TaxID=873517 RepID=E4MQB9_CAPOC|nr:DUF4304 domain-containing protein [Capnocytophaga ochracea]EFS98120.1 hypothetical protein HMPREF1977_0603 [Capnocytophaga ochracea F0287]EJF45404.1 PF14137 domain protein [Capnocytophaga ochracea str. Holt 25]UEB43622.1 DUF4304 domain-containing protein [Capnocytophaga ochracea]